MESVVVHSGRANGAGRYIIACLFLGFVLSPSALRAQSPESAWEAAYETLAETQPDDEAASALALEDLQERLAHPLCINTATYDELEALGLLTPWEIEALLHYRETYGLIVGAHELQYIQDFPPEKARQIAPFLSFEQEKMPETWAQTLRNRGRHELALRYGRALSRSKAYTEHRYAGTPDAAALRYRFRADDRLQIGLAMEKDAGEKGLPDSWAGFLMFGDARPPAASRRALHLKQWIIGAYRLHFGYGLHLGGGLFGGGLDAEQLTRYGGGLKPFAATAESGYFSGSALRLQTARNTEITLFYSHRKIDAAVENGWITSLPTGGYHRTESECEKRRQATQQVMGLAAERSLRRTKMGGVFSYTFLDQPFQPSVSLYNQFNHLSDKVLGGSIYYRTLWRGLHLYGEAGWSGILREGGARHTFSAAVFQGLQWKIHPRFGLAAQLRCYPRSYGGFFVNAQGRQSKAYNEYGLGILARTNITDRLHLDAAADMAVHTWYAYPKKPPFTERRYDLRLSYAARRHALQAYILYQYRQAGEAASATHRLRLHLTYDSPGGFLYRSRIELHPASETDYLLYQDFGYRLPNGKFSCNARFALFQTAPNGERFYAYESDLLYNAAFPSYGGRGQRFYIFLRYKPFKFMTFEARYAHTLYDHQFTSGSGLNESPGGLQPEVKGQIRFKF